MRFWRKCLTQFFPRQGFSFFFPIPFICCFNGRSGLANRAPIGRSPRVLIGRESISRIFYFSLDDLTKDGKIFNGVSQSNSLFEFFSPFWSFFTFFRILSCFTSKALSLNMFYHSFSINILVFYFNFIKAFNNFKPRCRTPRLFNVLYQDHKAGFILLILLHKQCYVPS